MHAARLLDAGAATGQRSVGSDDDDVLVGDGDDDTLYGGAATTPWSAAPAAMGMSISGDGT